MSDSILENETASYWRNSSELRRMRREATDHQTNPATSEAVDELDIIVIHSDSPRLKAAAIAAIAPEVAVEEEKVCESSA